MTRHEAMEALVFAVLAGNTEFAGIERLAAAVDERPQFTYEACHEALGGVLLGLTILSGEQVGPSGKSWQDVAHMTASRARDLADLLLSAAEGRIGETPSFPSPGEVLGEVDQAGEEFSVEVDE